MPTQDLTKQGLTKPYINKVNIDKTLKPIKIIYMKKSLLKYAIIGSFLLASLSLQGCLTDKNTNTIQWPLLTDCDLHLEACTATKEEQSLQLSIVPKPIPVARSLGVEIIMENLSADKVELDISGLNMYMGFNRVSLSQTQPNLWQGSSMLAFCTLDKMEWQITVILHHTDPETQIKSQTQIPFSLITTNSLAR